MKGIKQTENYFEHSLVAEETHPELLSLREELSSITKELDQFTYIVSHDLQAPLRMVTGFLELLEKKYEDKLDDQAKLYIGYAVKGAEKMKRLIFDLLEYSRVSTSNEPFETVELEEVFSEIAQKKGALFADNNITVRTDQLPVVFGRRKQLLQMFEHLIDNAVKFRGTVSPIINILVKQENANWKIGVEDNGIGIEKSFFEKIFLVFRRLHPDEEKYKGTGIGLAICKKVCEIHEGQIEVDSAPGKGSIFWVTLPIKSF